MVGGKATGIPKGTGIVRDPPAVPPAAKRTAKGKGHLLRWHLRVLRTEPGGSCQAQLTPAAVQVDVIT